MRRPDSESLISCAWLGACLLVILQVTRSSFFWAWPRRLDCHHKAPDWCFSEGCNSFPSRKRAFAMALSSRRQGCKLLSRTLKSLSGVVNDDLTGVERSAFSGLASRSVPQGSLGKALLRSFWAGSWKPLPARTYLGHQHEEYSSIIYPPTEAKVGKTAPDFSAPGCTVPCLAIVVSDRRSTL